MSDQDLKINDLENKYQSMAEKIDELKDTVVNGFSELRKDLKDNYVSKESFLPVKAIAYGLAGSVLFAFLSAVIALVIANRYE